MRGQKELKEMYMEIIKKEVWAGDTHMQEYARKTCAYVVELSDGCIIDIDKPTIQKNFCFGAGMYASASDEEMSEAEKMAEYARTSEKYFKVQNLKKLDDEIRALQDAKSGKYEVYAFLHYCGQESGSKLKSYSICRISGNPEYEPGYWSNYKDLKKLKSDDINRIIAGLEEVKKAFSKRLDTYLKRYGTSKVNAWSYIRD